MRFDQIHNPTERLNQVQVLFWKQFDEFQEKIVDFHLALVKYSGRLVELQEGKEKAALYAITEYGKLIKDKRK